MQWTVKTERMDAGTGCRNATAERGDARFAGIYNGDGYGIANIDRLGRVDAAGRVDFVHDHVACNDEPMAHATTDAQWGQVIAVLSAAPEMVSLLKAIYDDLGCGEGLSAAEADVVRCSIATVLEKAEQHQIA